MTDFIVAESGIRQLQARYVDAVWRKDYNAFGDCFTEDAAWRVIDFADSTTGNPDAGVVEVVIRGRIECVKFLEGIMVHFDRVFMTMQTPILQIGNGAAIGRTRITEQNARKDRQPFFSIATYYDRFVQQGDRWRFTQHHFQLHFMGSTDLSGHFIELDDYGPPFGMPPQFPR